MGSIFYRGLSISYGQIGFIGFNRVIQFTEARSTAAFRIVHAGFTAEYHISINCRGLLLRSW